jgi:hypothetical protein
MPNLSKDDILKALECCTPENESCLNCPLIDVSVPECAGILYKSTIDLINSQQAEKEKLQKNILKYENIFINSQKTSKYWHNKCIELAEEIQSVKSESINVFSEKLYNHILAYFVIGDKDIVMKLSELKNVIEIIKSEMELTTNENTKIC